MTSRTSSIDSVSVWQLYGIKVSNVERQIVVDQGNKLVSPTLQTIIKLGGDLAILTQDYLASF